MGPSMLARVGEWTADRKSCLPQYREYSTEQRTGFNQASGTCSFGSPSPGKDISSYIFVASLIHHLSGVLPAGVPFIAC